MAVPTSQPGALPAVMAATMSRMRSVSRVKGESSTSPAMDRFWDA